jgi:hypothetical protein
VEQAVLSGPVPLGREQHTSAVFRDGALQQVYVGFLAGLQDAQFGVDRTVVGNHPVRPRLGAVRRAGVDPGGPPVADRRRSVGIGLGEQAGGNAAALYEEGLVVVVGFVVLRGVVMQGFVMQGFVITGFVVMAGMVAIAGFVVIEPAPAPPAAEVVLAQRGYSSIKGKEGRAEPLTMTTTQPPFPLLGRVRVLSRPRPRRGNWFPLPADPYRRALPRLGTSATA